MSVFFLEQGVSANEESFFACHNINKAPKLCFSTLKLCSIGFSLHLHSLFGNKSFSSMVYVLKRLFFIVYAAILNFELLIVNN